MVCACMCVQGSNPTRDPMIQSKQLVNSQWRDVTISWNESYRTHTQFIKTHTPNSITTSIQLQVNSPSPYSADTPSLDTVNNTATNSLPEREEIAPRS